MKMLNKRKICVISFVVLFFFASYMFFKPKKFVIDSNKTWVQQVYDLLSVPDYAEQIVNAGYTIDRGLVKYNGTVAEMNIEDEHIKTIGAERIILKSSPNEIRVYFNEREKISYLVVDDGRKYLNEENIPVEYKHLIYEIVVPKIKAILNNIAAHENVKK